ncbi:MAG: prolipoprotein diacylglyceryl transferase [Actinomycetota bacterium]|nr:prolipoprotein diacylglyceryl transferase [Actinomycetota bacterium]
MDPQGLAATYWIDTDAWKGPGEVSVRFSGIRADSAPGARPVQFERYEDVEAITPGIGRIAVTTHVSDISAGTWQVAAAPVSRTGTERQRVSTALPGTTPLLSTVHTRFGPFVHAPGVHLLSWPLLVGLGAVLAVTLLAMFLAVQGVDPTGPVWLAVLANAVGGVGARLWWLALNRQPLRSFLKAGACIQGFLAGGLATVIVGALVFGWPVGRILDATAVGIFFGMAVGRPGCFFTGCCYGRPTASRWGMWSSDRRIGRRRHPVQLYEAVLALLIGLGTLPFMLGTPPRIPGLVFVGSVTIYTLGRQLLFPLRVDPRTRRGRAATIVACTLILGADILAAVAL